MISVIPAESSRTLWEEPPISTFLLLQRNHFNALWCTEGPISGMNRVHCSTTDTVYPQSRLYNHREITAICCCNAALSRGKHVT